MNYIQWNQNQNKNNFIQENLIWKRVLQNGNHICLGLNVVILHTVGYGIYPMIHNITPKLTLTSRSHLQPYSGGLSV